MNLKIRLGVAVATAALVVPTAVFAQDAATTRTPPERGDTGYTQGDGGGASANDIVVTAQRREERLKDVPISITAISGESLRETGISNVKFLGQVVPGLNYQAAGSTAQPAIRGITSTGAGGGDASNVALYIDGVYQDFNFANYQELVDLSGVQVLKGPQGTLFGRNAAGGAILIKTLDPTDELTGIVRAGYGNHQQFEGSAFVAGPLIGEDVLGSIAVNGLKNDGYVRNIVSGDEDAYTKYFSARGKLMFQISEDASLKLTGFYLKSDDSTTQSGHALNCNTIALGLVPTAPLACDDPWEDSLSFQGRVKNKSLTGSAELKVQLGDISLSSQTSYLRNEVTFLSDTDLSPRNISSAKGNPVSTSFSQELLLTSPTADRFNWVAGVFYYQNRNIATTTLLGGTPPDYTAPLFTTTLLRARVFTKAYAVFGEANYALTPRLTLTGGLRFSEDKQHYSVISVLSGASTAPPEATFKAWTPRASLRYELSDDLNAYVTYSRGFKSGVFASTSFAQLPVRPETVDAFEGGLKGSLGRALSYNLAVYHYEDKNIQVQSFPVPIIPSLTNAARGRITGFEASGSLRVAQGITLNGGFSYIHARYVKFPGAVALIPKPTGGNSQPVGGLDASGNPMIRTPEYSGSIGVNAEYPLAGGKIEFNGNFYAQSRQYYDAISVFSQKSYALLNASVAYVFPDEHFRVTLHAENITNTAHLMSLQVSSAAASANYGPPRSYGIRAEYSF